MLVFLDVHLAEPPAGPAAFVRFAPVAGVPTKFGVQRLGRFLRPKAPKLPAEEACPRLCGVRPWYWPAVVDAALELDRLVVDVVQ